MGQIRYIIAQGLCAHVHLIVSDHQVGVVVKTSKKAQGAQSATPIISATGTISM